MSDRRVQGEIELSRRPAKALKKNLASRSPFGRRIFNLRDVASILLTLVVLYLVYRELMGLDWREAWGSILGTNAGLFALAFGVFYCSFLLRTLRWKTLLANVGYDRAVHYMPSTLGLTRIMYLAWFANCLTIA